MVHLDFEPPPGLSGEFSSRLSGHFTGQEIQLPVLSEAAAKLLSITSKPDVDLDEVAGLVQTDQSLCSNVLRVANSAAYAPAITIESVPQAVSRLGMRAVGEIAVLMVARNQLYGPLMGDSELVRGMWQHAAVAGVYARRIGLIHEGDQPASVLTGLLADVGQPVVFKVLHELAQDLNEPLEPMTLAYLIDMLHVPIGVMLAEAWRLPEPVTVAIAHHHDYAAASEHTSSAMTAHLADLMATWCLRSEDHSTDDLRGLPVVAELGLDSEALGSLLEDPEEALEAAAAFA